MSSLQLFTVVIVFAIAAYCNCIYSCLHNKFCSTSAMTKIKKKQQKNNKQKKRLKLKFRKFKAVKFHMKKCLVNRPLMVYIHMFVSKYNIVQMTDPALMFCPLAKSKSDYFN